MRIDSNTLGRYGYILLKEKGVIENKDKSELTFKDSAIVKELLLGLIENNLNEVKESKLYSDKNLFSLVFYSSILAYVNDTDLNKYITLSTDGKVKEETVNSTTKENKE